MKYLLVILLGAVVVMQASAQQIPQLSFRHQNVLLNNPAAAGSSARNDISLLHRQQWLGFEHAPATSLISYSQTFLGNNGIGGYLISDRTFPTSRFIINASYAYIIETEKLSLSFGIAAMVMQYKFKNTDLNYRDPLDPSLSFSADQKWRPEANAGIMAYNNRFYASFSVSQLLQSGFRPFSSGSEGLVQNTRHFIGSGQYSFLIKDHSISPGLYLGYAKSSPLMAEVSVQYIFRQKISFSLGYRWDDALNASIGYRYDRFYLGYSFDLVTSSFRVHTSGSHEIMLSMNIAGNKQNEPMFGTRAGKTGGLKRN